MLKIYLLIFIIAAGFSVAVAQRDSLSAKDKALLDSVMENDEFLKMMKEPVKNSVDIGIGFGNGAFSSDNNAANATGIDNKIIFTPSIIYHIKYGFSFGVTGFLTSDSANKLELYQTGIIAAYDYYGKKMLAGFSYTRYLSDKNKYNTKSLYQNDIYGYIKKAHGILQPGIALGYANGNYREVSFTSFILKRPLRGDTLIKGFDSTDNKTSYFSASVSVGHEFSFYKLFCKEDGLEFTPSVIVNMGSDKNSQTHTNKIFDRFRKLSGVKKTESNNKFQLQSVAASFDFTYGIGKFFLQPNIYLDYYLPETTAKRFTTIFSVSAGLSF
jgi:hypothetical protein